MGVSRVYLLDSSGSMSNTEGVIDFSVPKIEQAKAELTKLLGSKDRFCADDRVALITFKNRKGKPALETVIPFQNAHSIAPSCPHLIREISTISAEGGTPIGLALFEALSQTSHEEGEREIVLITDADYSLGEDPRLGIYEAILQQAKINVVYMGVSEKLGVLEPLARRTGGTLRRVRRAAELHKVLFYPPTPQLDAETMRILAEASGVTNRNPSANSRTGSEASSFGFPLSAELKALKTTLAKRQEDLKNEIAALTLERQGPLLRLTGIRQMFLSREIGKKEYLKRAAEPEEKLGEIARGIAVRQYARNVLNSFIYEMNAVLEGSRN
ncbi:MAG: VWA domain-containing protein [Candidatus Verstraetearchaeota archaeon]|nr:VWA domain-containing protein [Candidatus Verstraetearchaeota archaeon]